MKKFLCILAVICMAVFFSACFEVEDPLSPTRVAVTLDLDGGEIDGGVSYTAKTGENLVINQPSKYGFDFVGWSYNGEIVSLTPFNVNEYAVTLKAEWEVKPCTITVELNGGSFEDGKPLIYVVKVGEDAKIPTPTKRGYEFEGWYYNSGEIELNPFNTPNVFDMKLKAKWSTKSYLVNFDFNGGKMIMQGEELTSCLREQTFDKEVDFPIPQKDGYLLKGYEVNGELVENGIWNFDEENLTAVACWDPILVGYSLDLDGGQLSIEGGIIKYGSTTQPLNEIPITKKGYDFAGWMVDGQLIGEFWEYLPTVGSKVKLVASWSPKSYKVTLNAGEGRLEGDLEHTLKYGTQYDLPIPTPIEGKKFVGWKIESLDKIITTPTGSVVYNYEYFGELTAVYSESEYLIFINLDGSIERVMIPNYEDGEEEDDGSFIDIPTPIAKTGYLVEWELSSDEINELTETTEIRAVITRALDYVAVFKSDGRELFTIRCTYDSIVTLPTEDYLYQGEYKARKSGYRLLGWSLTPDDKENYFNQIKWEFNKHTYFYPVYEARSYNITYDYSNIKVQSTLYNGEMVTSNSQTVVFGDVYSLYTLKVTEDLATVSWSYNGEIIADSGIWKITSDATLVATIKPENYKPVEIDVNVNLNGGSGKPFATIVLGKKLNTLTNVPTPPADYKLVGYTYRNKTYSLSDIWDVLDYDGEPLVAQYEYSAKEIEVNLDLNGGTGKLKAKIRVGYKLTTISPKPEAQNGYKLTGFIYNDKFYAINDVWDVEDYDGSLLIAQYEEDDAEWGPDV